MDDHETGEKGAELADATSAYLAERAKRAGEPDRGELIAARDLVIEHEAVKAVAAVSGRITPRKLALPIVGLLAALATI